MLQFIVCDKPIEYNQAMQWFKNVQNVKPKSTNIVEEYIYVLEHKDVYTAGKSIINNEAEKNIKEIHETPVIYTERGGLWTWHGKGQVVVYFLYNLRKRNLSLSKFMSIIEDVAIECVKDNIKQLVRDVVVNNNNIVNYNDDNDYINNNIIILEHEKLIFNKLKIFADQNKRGFWIKNLSNNDVAKFGFMGFKVSNGFLTHGISINYNNNLKWFDYIDPCGLGDVKITSITEIVKNLCINAKSADNNKIVESTNNGKIATNTDKEIKDDQINLDINNFKYRIGNKLLTALNFDEKK